MKWPVFVPSKGRPDSVLINKLLQTSYVVIEPQDRLIYENKIGKGRLVILPENDRGIGYVRQFILERCRALGGWYWMLDDDISSFYRTENSKLIKIDPEKALCAAEDLILKQSNVGQAALEYAQFAWSQTKPVKFFGYCDVAVAVNTELTSFANYRSEMNLKEDRDFTLQILANGARTMRCSMISFRAPKNGSNKGGLHSVYAKRGREESAVDRMVFAWPGIVQKQVKKDGRVDCKIDWKFFSK
jgi:hypothetical protein